MGKKSRAASGRRPILQLSPPGPRGPSTAWEENVGSGSEDDQEGSGDASAAPSYISKEIEVEPVAPAVKATVGLSLLGAYAESDEEEGAEIQPEKPKHNQSGDIDSTLASFLAEIDAITTQPAQPPGEPATASWAPPPTPPRPEPKDQQHPPNHATFQNGEVSAVAGIEFQYDTQYSLAGVGIEMGDWQEVWDENTGCHYYWNTQTNEVTWQLPQDLANQVQGIQQYHNSSLATVNGTGAHSNGLYQEQNAVGVASAQTTKRESKKQEVMESVQALTSEEEERQGVAASLLAPLIPPEIKESEERWRKRALGLEVDPEEEEVDSKGDGHIHGDVDADANSQSGESSDAEMRNNEEEETEEDTRDLELALERKKAELRALEEGDGSLMSSSPRSDASQEGSKSSLLRKGKWKTTFVRSASPDSNSRSSDKNGRDSPDIGDATAATGVSKTNEKTLEEEQQVNSEVFQDKAKARPAVKEEEDDEDVKLKFQIGELANTLTSKMDFLGINKKTISNFQLLLLQIETRIADWRDGALNGIYLKRKLQEAAEQIKHYEINATPKGWSCHWDRDHRRYFYVNDVTSASQWEFPDVEEEEEAEGKDTSAEQNVKNEDDGHVSPEPKVLLTDNSNYLCLPAVTPSLPVQTYWTVPQPPLPPACDPLHRLHPHPSPSTTPTPTNR
ncbi:formin-binding protein 4-like [Polypterus senegalus]|uniref:formin-binding protein 4-like n=1 Tax=Polypterus senegalus TaxID=55291 RepID=UPI001962D1B0|nr:formin-binding protein 4-like [Polypterus senegalus]